MSTKSDVFVIKEGSKYLVRPGFIIVRRQKSFRLRNFSGRDVGITLPEAFGAGKRPITVKAGKGKTLKVPRSTPAGAYAYTVEVGEKEAQGNSAPIIIIDR